MTDSDQEDWKSRYRKEVLEWERAEELLWRALGRLAIGALGAEPQLDQILQRVQKSVKARDLSGLDSDVSSLVSLLRDLDAAAGNQQLDDQATDSRAAAAKAASSIGDVARPLLLSIIDELSVAQAGSPSLQTLRQSLQANADIEPARTTERVVVELRLAIQRIRNEKIALEHLVEEVSEELGSISLVLGEEREELDAGQQDVSDLREAMSKSVDQIQSDIRDENDIEKLKARITDSLQGIRTGISEFVRRDQTRFQAAQARNKQLKNRIAAMEREANALQEKLSKNREEMMRDTLTGVSSRLAYDEAIAREISRYQRYGEDFCIAVVDIDHFKRVNDTYGHSAGDKALTLVARIIQERVRDTDGVFRVGGEEFVLLFPATTADAATPVLDALRTAVSESQFHYEGQEVSITLSAGLTNAASGDTAETIFSRADDAMYRAKKAGRNRVLTDA